MFRGRRITERAGRDGEDKQKSDDEVSHWKIDFRYRAFAPKLYFTSRDFFASRDRWSTSQPLQPISSSTPLSFGTSSRLSFSSHTPSLSVGTISAMRSRPRRASS